MTDAKQASVHKKLAVVSLMYSAVASENRLLNQALLMDKLLTAANRRSWGKASSTLVEPADAVWWARIQQRVICR